MIFSTSAWVKGAVCSSWRDAAAFSAAVTPRSSRLERAAAPARDDDARVLRPSVAAPTRSSPCAHGLGCDRRREDHDKSLQVCTSEARRVKDASHTDTNRHSAGLQQTGGPVADVPGSWSRGGWTLQPPPAVDTAADERERQHRLSRGVGQRRLVLGGSCWGSCGSVRCLFRTEPSADLAGEGRGEEEAQDQHGSRRPHLDDPERADSSSATIARARFAATQTASRRVDGCLGGRSFAT